MTATPKAVVGIVMGSDSDWPVMQAAAQVLEEFGVKTAVEDFEVVGYECHPAIKAPVAV